jgi:hypothetical protein
MTYLMPFRVGDGEKAFLFDFEVGYSTDDWKILTSLPVYCAMIRINNPIEARFFSHRKNFTQS